MERYQYSANDDAYGAVTNNGLFGRDAVEAAAPVEPLPDTPPRFEVNVDDVAATPNSNDESGAWYLTPLAAFGAAVALALGVFAGGNLLLNYGDQISAFWNGHDDPPVIAERAFAGAVTSIRLDRPRPIRRPKTEVTLPDGPEAEFVESAEDSTAELPDEFFEESPDRAVKHHEAAGADRTKRFKDLEKIRERNREGLKRFLELNGESEDN